MNLKILPPNLLPQVSKFTQKYLKHLAFGSIIVVLAVYIFVVFKIGSLSKAEPQPGQGDSSAKLIPRVNQKAVDQIQSLEENNTQIHSLFEQARNNPFSE